MRLPGGVTRRSRGKGATHGAAGRAASLGPAAGGKK